MDDRDRSGSPYDRNDGRFAGRDDDNWQDQSNRGSREWDRQVRDWERGGRGDAWRSSGRDLRQHNDLRSQHSDLRSQGRGFRDERYGSRFDSDHQQSLSDGSYQQGAYSGPTGTYSGYRDDWQDGSERWRSQSGVSGQHGQDWGRGAQEGYYGGGPRGFASPQEAHDRGDYQRSYRQGGYSQGGSPGGSQGARYGSHGSYGASSQGGDSRHHQGSGGYGARGYESEGSRGDSREHESFGQHLREAGQNMVRSVKRAFLGPKGYKRSDERIHEDVCDRLAQQDHVDPSEIEVQVQNGEVTLTGTVKSRQEKFLAEEITDDVSGVSEVHNQLRVQRANAPQASSSSSTTASSLGSASEAGATQVRNGRA